MHMALVPAGKVDYSVTKGGLRLWAVVFVFIILCSCLYTVFQGTELAYGEELHLNTVFKSLPMQTLKTISISTKKATSMTTMIILCCIEEGSIQKAMRTKVEEDMRLAMKATKMMKKATDISSSGEYVERKWR